MALSITKDFKLSDDGIVSLVQQRVQKGKYIHFKTNTNKQAGIEVDDVFMGVMPPPEGEENERVGFFKFTGGDIEDPENYLTLTAYELTND